MALTEDDRARIAAVRHELEHALEVASRTGVSVILKKGRRQLKLEDVDDIEYKRKRSWFWQSSE